MELQQKHNKVEHRLFVTKNLLDEANAELEFRAKVIEELENRGIRDLMMGRYPDTYLEYKRGINNFLHLLLFLSKLI